MKKMMINMKKMNLIMIIMKQKKINKMMNKIICLIKQSKRLKKRKQIKKIRKSFNQNLINQKIDYKIYLNHHKKNFKKFKDYKMKLKNKVIHNRFINI